MSRDSKYLQSSSLDASSSKLTPGASNASTKSSGSALGRKLSSLLPSSRKSTPQGSLRDKNEYGLSTVFQPEGSAGVIADFVFVHGLGGGSSTTWSIKSKPESFWPKEWLPRDPDFDGIRVHSFGYNANWRKREKSPLDVHAFGQSLVEDLLSDPKIKASNTPIVLIGHSMGGLVIKKACILSKTNSDYAHLANRFHSFYFLGTPHRGASLAKVLNNLLRISGTGRRPYIAGLESQSEMIRTLNDGFRVNYSGIHLHTFYESQPTPPLGLIVDAESATLGYAEERSQLLNANHKNLTKFESATDSNYRSLRNRLASTVQQIRDERGSAIGSPRLPGYHEDMAPSSLLNNVLTCPEPEMQSLSLLQSHADHDQLETIRAYLSVDQSPDDILSSLDDTRLKGSCTWLPEKSLFQQWRCSSTARHFLLKGPPASGKSTMSSFIVEYLKGCGSPVCCYFFKSGEEATSNFSSFLRSMAYQMARVNPSVRHVLFQQAQCGPAIETRNQKSIWHNIYMNCVFQKDLGQMHFWVIDALDEAAERGYADEFFRFLLKIDREVPLKIFITSRPTFALDTLSAQLPTVTQLMTPDDYAGDMRQYVETWSANLPVADASEREMFVENIVDRSGGCFLWTVLVIRKLQEVLTVEEIHEVLREVPQKMNELYQHNIKKMEASRSRTAVKHIIVWTICAVQRLTVDEMKDAIKLSQGITLARDLRTSLQYLCGQFLDVDKHACIHVVHETARAFLTDPNLDSEFRVDYAEGHTIIAIACFDYLLGDDLKHSRWRRSSAMSLVQKNSMTDYVCLRWSEHIMRSSSSSDHLFDLLVKFFQTNVLSWIERVAQLKDLDCLNRTTRHLSSFLGRRTKYVPMLPRDLKAWVVDLPRIVTQFGANLLNDPSAIHTLIPPFCPRDSAIHRQFGYAEDGIKLVGAWNSGWDDRICSISYHETYPKAVSARDHRFAVGLADGLIKLYRMSTCEEDVTLEHGEPPSVLEFGPTTRFLASAGLKHVRLWETRTGKQLLHISTPSQILALSFNETETCLIVASRSRHLSVYQISDGARLCHLQWTDSFVETKYSGYPPSPSDVHISVELQVMAIIYRSKPVQLWSLESHRPIGACIRPSTHKHSNAGHLVHSAAFNPVPAHPGLLVTYWDDFVAVYDVKTCKTLASMSTSLDKVAIAPNGKTFAGSDGTGSIKILDFETLQVLHRIQDQTDTVSSLAFSSDSLQIIDVRHTHANVWKPLVLVSQDSDSQSSEPSESVNQIVDEMSVSTVDESAVISSLYYCEESRIAFCGRNDGSVDTCNLDDPEKPMRNLYKHRGTFTSITCIGWAYRPRIAASADTSGKVRVMQITTGSRREWSAGIIFEAQLDQGQAINQVAVRPEGSYVLVSSSESDSVWSITTMKLVATRTSRRRTAWKWFIRPSTTSQLLLFNDKVLKLFDWADLAEIAASEPASISGELERLEPQRKPCVDADAISISSEGDDLVFTQKIHYSHQALQAVSYHPSPLTKVHVFDISSLGPYPILSASPPTHMNSSSTSSHLSPFSSPSHLSSSSLGPEFRNWFSDSPLASPPSGALSERRSSIRNVAEIPDVEIVIGTVKRFNSWFLVFISRLSWVCTVELGGGGGKVPDTFQKHFFVPSVWRTANACLICKICRGQDIIFVHQDGVIVIKNGLDNGQHVPFK
ncbi:hypothetical protein QQS21_005178 [Conoideocrella luteorostrata]|uniref:GPI inositol-deacylase n=1 Tax=Conoideocrella luteorostrata TaxID=1105319 RepID=A0AAJ0G139_9HYPO|nr:hypothetical protein QQS21_005178 [Conoideocrella luteorostrata]